VIQRHRDTRWAREVGVRGPENLEISYRFHKERPRMPHMNSTISAADITRETETFYKELKEFKPPFENFDRRQIGAEIILSNTCLLLKFVDTAQVTRTLPEGYQAS